MPMLPSHCLGKTEISRGQQVIQTGRSSRNQSGAETPADKGRRPNTASASMNSANGVTKRYVERLPAELRGPGGDSELALANLVYKRLDLLMLCGRCVLKRFGCLVPGSLLIALFQERHCQV